jgi:hypothetical protein
MADEIKNGENNENAGENTDNQQNNNAGGGDAEAKKGGSTSNGNKKDLENKIAELETQINTLMANRDNEITEVAAKLKYKYDVKKYLDGKNLANGITYESFETKINTDIDSLIEKDGVYAFKSENLDEIFDKFAKDKEGNYISGIFADVKTEKGSQGKIDFSVKVGDGDSGGDKFGDALKAGAGLSGKK